MKIIMGSDHYGYSLKEDLKAYLEELGHEPVDLGCHGAAEPVDYPDVAVEVAESLPEVQTDPELLERVVANLVENAIRHTSPGTAVTVSVGRWEARAILKVRDAGPGISAADQEHLFERFYRVGGDRASGSGLGLAIARELAGKMAGTLKVTSQPGETVFTLSLPLTSSLGPAESPPSAAPVST